MREREKGMGWTWVARSEMEKGEFYKGHSLISMSHSQLAERDARLANFGSLYVNFVSCWTFATAREGEGRSPFIGKQNLNKLKQNVHSNF